MKCSNCSGGSKILRSWQKDSLPKVEVFKKMLRGPGPYILCDYCDGLARRAVRNGTPVITKPISGRATT